jgi:hypothetical protein
MKYLESDGCAAEKYMMAMLGCAQPLDLVELCIYMYHGSLRAKPSEPQVEEVAVGP